MPVTLSVQDLVARAQERVNTLSPDAVDQRRVNPGVLLVDVRDVRERKRDGHIPGSLHVPRGMLEFWVDPESPYHKPELAQAQALILYCNKGWRSALAAATLQDMGLGDVAHMDGGFDRWAEQQREIERD
ncbi:Rhodanese domain-containing protein [Salinisphaera sp. C84B14]|uniref:rhodanese-like domain-containing protein n=1 Tax=Salinisphaera sp. C84B14 TaxID=1304155 RepID=UPI0032B1147D|tara:strand:- start:99 stop:488 length:390 start_codon:yes stop_codon:yes gene_type:complete